MNRLVPRSIALLLPVLALATALLARAQDPASGGDVNPDLIFEYQKRGRLAYEDGNYRRAEAYFEKYYLATVSLHQPVTMWVVDAAESLVKARIPQGKRQEARAVLDELPGKVAAFDPPAVLSPGQRHRLQYWRAELLRLDDKPGEALPLFRQVAEANDPPDYQPRALLGVGQCLLALRSWAEAEEALTAAQQAAAPEHLPIIKVGRGQALLRQGKNREAANWADRHFADLQGHLRAELGMVKIEALLALAEPRSAFATYVEGLAEGLYGDFRRSPDAFPVLRQLGRALLAAEEYDSAITTFERLFTSAPEERQRQDLLLELAEAAAAGQQWPRALAELDRFLDLYRKDPRRFQVRIRMAEINERLPGGINDALRHYDLVYNDEAASQPQRYFCAMALGRLFRREKQDVEKAVVYFLGAADLDVPPSDQALATFYAAESYFENEKYPRAGVFYQKVATQFPESSVAREARFKQGISLMRQGLHAMAVEAFADFQKRWPEDPDFGVRAVLYRGLSEAEAGHTNAAINTLEAFVDANPRHAEAPLALLKASAACAAAENRQLEAISLLTRLIADYRDKPQYPDALYRRAYLNLANGLYDEFLADSQAFLKDFADTWPAKAAEIELWLGDYHVGRQEYEQARTYFLAIPDRFADTPEAPDALYEAAKCAYRLARANDNDPELLAQALAELDRLDRDFPAASPRTRAQAHFLRGDILSLQGNFEAASKEFRRIAELVPNTQLYYAATGRLGECLYSWASTLQDSARDGKLEEARKQFESIVEREDRHGNAAFVEMARYRLGRIYELRDEREEAIKQYYQIYYAYLASPVKLYWQYFSRAGFRLAKLYVDNEQYSAAVQVYEALAEQGIPTSEDAKLRAQVLSQRYEK